MKQAAVSSRIARRRVEPLIVALEPRRFLSAGGDTAPATPHSSDRVWSHLERAPDAAGRMLGISASHVETFQLNSTRMRALLATAGDEKLAAGIGLGGSAIDISVPTPEGTLARFKIVQTHIMEPGLEAQFPQIRTYSGIGIDDPNARITLDFNTLGFHAQVRSPNGMYSVDPYIHLNPGVYGSHYRSDGIRRAGNPVANLQDDVDHAIEARLPAGGGSPLEVDTGSQLRTYRLANAATGEYTQFFGGTVVNAQSAIVTSINRVNQVLELDMTIRLSLVANNTAVIFTQPLMDPYNNNDLDFSLNQNVCDSFIGTANYDVGHVFGTFNGGRAGIAVVGVAGQKARGFSGFPTPIGDDFDIDFVAHELGHQFGAFHTFNSANDLPNRTAAHAYEPGSGNTIMSYAGITGANSDLQLHADPCYHFDSIAAFVNHCDITIPFVGTRTPTGNAIPVVEAGPNFTIPAQTPFLLTGSATDANGDTLTYCWEERDLGPAQLITDPDNGSSPLMRGFLPTTSNTRSLPLLETVLSGQLNTPAPFGGSSERPATTNRTLNWRLTVRDNRANGGASSSDDMAITVVNTGAGFSVSSFNSGVVQLPEGSTQAIDWNVAGTSGGGINAANVKISMSTNGGTTFPIVIAASTPNDGSEDFVVPFGQTGSARFKIEAVGNIFYDINNINVQIVAGGTVSATPAQPDLSAASDTGVSNTDNITKLNNSDVASQLTFTVGNTVSGATVQLFADGGLIGQAVATGTTTTIVTNGTSGMGNGTRNITARQTEPGKSQSPDSSILGVTVDTLPPIPSQFTVFNRLIGPHQLQISFGEDMTGGIPGTALSLVNTSFGGSNGTAAVAFDTGTNIATFTFPAAPSGIGVLSNGNYSATLQNTLVTDIAGNQLTVSRVLNFFFVNGDANNDRTCELADFATLSVNFNVSPRLFSQGDYNYSGGVELGDFAILAANYNVNVPPADLPRGAAAVSPATPFSSARIDQQSAMQLLDDASGEIA